MDGGSADAQSDEGGTATPSLPENEDELDEGNDEVTGQGCGGVGEVCYAEIEINGLVSSLDVGESDGFTVRAFDFDTDYRYRMRVRRSDPGNNDIGMNNCSSSQSPFSTAPSGSDSHTHSYTLRGCHSGSGTVVAELFLVNNSTVIASDSQDVRVVGSSAANTPTPTRTPTQRPNSPTPTPTPTTAGDRIINFDWDDAANATGYDVQQWSGYDGAVGWRILPFYEAGSLSNFQIPMVQARW